MNPGKRKIGPQMEQRLPKHQALSKRKSTILSAVQLSGPNAMALAYRQPAVRLPSEVMTSTYGATSARSPNLMSSGPHFGTSSQAFTPIDSLGDYSHGHTVPGPARQHSTLTNNIFSQDGLSAIDPALAAYDLHYGGTSHPLTQVREPGIDLTHPNPAHLAIRGDAVPHFKLEVVAPELSQDSAAVLPSGWTDRNEPMVDPNSLQTAQPGYSNMTTTYAPAQYAHAEDIPSQPANQVPDFPSVCFLCPQTTGPIQPPIYNTVDDYNVHLWQEHSDLSTWTLKKCIWRGCTTSCAFATAKLCMLPPASLSCYSQEPRVS